MQVIVNLIVSCHCEPEGCGNLFVISGDYFVTTFLTMTNKSVQSVSSVVNQTGESV